MFLESPHPTLRKPGNADGRAGAVRAKGVVVLLVLCALGLVFPVAPSARAADKTIVLCQIGESAPAAWSSLRQYFESKGYQVTYYQAESTIERHVEKVSGLNRGGGRLFLAVELIPAAQSRVMVAMTDAKKGEGRFLTIDQIPDKFSAESEKIARLVAAQFKTKVKHLPLFPLLGVSMPGVFIRMEFKEGQLEDAIARIESGVERYFTERITP